MSLTPTKVLYKRGSRFASATACLAISSFYAFFNGACTLYRIKNGNMNMNLIRSGGIQNICVIET